MPSINSASRTFQLPGIPSELSSGLTAAESQAQLRAKIKRDIERYGWEKALRRIIKTTSRKKRTLPDLRKPPQRRHRLREAARRRGGATRTRGGPLRGG
jgi:hypothetical protein